MHFAYFNSPRCGAKTRKGTPCKSPAVRSKKRCRMHGGAKGSGAPGKNKNALKHGFTTQHAKNERKEVLTIIRESQKQLKNALHIHDREFNS